MTDRDTRPAGTRSIEAIQDDFRSRDYIADRSLATAVFLALELGRPLLLEGEAGVGKTELAKVLAASLGTKLIRLQCYEGLDVNTAVYEWNYPRQMLEIRLLEARGEAEHATAHDIFGADFLIRRPLLQALEATDGVAPVLLIDEIDRADEEFEAYLLEILSDFQVTVPEIGTIKAETPPRVILTSNRTREVHDALKRRCLYHWIDYPTAQKEYEIVLARVPAAPETAGARGRRVRPSPARSGPDQGAGHRRDARLGGGAAVARRAGARPRPRRRDARRRPQVRGGHPPGPRRRDPALSRRGRRRRLGRTDMGAWGTAAFDNDDASDWVYDLEKRGIGAIDDALSDAEGGGSLEMPADVNAIAAGEVVAAALGGLRRGCARTSCRSRTSCVVTSRRSTRLGRALPPSGSSPVRRWPTCGARPTRMAHGARSSTISSCD